MKRNLIGRVAKYGAIALGATVFSVGTCVTSEYSDVMGFSGDNEMGRTKNSLAAVIAGIAAQKMHGNSTLDLKIKKNLWSNARITGKTTSNSVQTDIDLALASVHFKADGSSSSNLSGTVDKSEFDWGLKQKDNASYDIARFGPKFDSVLHLNVQNGKIKGLYERRGPHINWDINGTYDSSGNVKIDVTAPLTLGITLEGKITGN